MIKMASKKTTKKTTKKKMGRPKIVIDKVQFEKLCSIQCTETEIADFFDCCEDTLNYWCKDTYDKTFSDISKIKSAPGKISLRRAQFKIAEKNPTMAIWLGKQYLGQRDIIENNITVDDAEFNQTLAQLLRKNED